MPNLSEILQGAGLTLSELQRRSGVSRVTLSRIVNGHQAPSLATASKLEPILGVSAEELMQPSSTRPAAPEILPITALQFRQWCETQPAKGELPELVSRLIRTELAAAGSIRAPSGEQFFEPGPDISMNAPRETRHIPRGRSVWEVSTEKEMRKKATKDLNRHRVPAGWRHDETSWVYVTTHAWPSKDKWILQQRDQHPWRSIRVLDATDLKSWIDESPGVQTWLMGRMGRKTSDFQSLRQAVDEWCSVADPPLAPPLLKASVDKHFTAWCGWVRLRPDRPLTIIGESRGEALLCLQALIERGSSRPSWMPLEGLCVNTEEGLRQLSGVPLSEVVVVPMNETVGELVVAHCGRVRVVLPRTGQLRVRDPLKVVRVGRGAVRDFLIRNEVDTGRATQLARSCGGSVTVLRRLTHKGGAQALCPQVSNRQSRILAAAGLFGVWDAGSKADRKVALRLTGQQCDEDVDEAWTDLLDLPETPVWMDGERRGVNSQLDTWLCFTEGKITTQAIDRFFDVVYMALSQAPLHRPGERLLLPKDYQVLRDSQVSAELLRGIAQGLVLLAEFGDSIDRRLVGARVAVRVDEAVDAALGGMTVDRLRALSEILPLLAESAPETFLAAMEADLEQPNSAQKALVNFRWDASESQPALQLLPDSEAMTYRSPLMWAYETLAWFPDYAERAIELLAQLADEDVLDHHGGQPRESLAKLLKPWNRGSVLDSKRHCVLLRKLAGDHPEWAFDLVRKCLPLDYDTTDQANLPLWRGRSDRADSEQSEEHRSAVYRTAAEILVQHAATSAETIHAAIDAVEDLPEVEATRVWQSIGAWAASESCSKEERTRLVRYLTSFADGAFSKRRREVDLKGAHGVLKSLAEFPVTAPDLWIFDAGAVIREHRTEDAGWRVTEDRLDRKRLAALRRDWESGGIEAILSLVHEVENTHFLGCMVSRVLPRDETNQAALRALQTGGDVARSQMRRFVQGLLAGMDDPDADALVEVIRSSPFAEQNPNWLPCLLARFPFRIGTVRTDGLSRGELNCYWQQFEPEWQAIPSGRKDWLIVGLCSVNRPRAALEALASNFEGARTESLRQLIDTLPRSKEQKSNHVERLEHNLVADIRARPDLSDADAAGIEFMFFDILTPEEMPALAKAVATDPSWFKEALMLCMARRDHGEDPPEWQERKENAPEGLRRRAFRLFGWLPRLPGTTSKEYKVELGHAWTKEILSFADEHDRRGVAETLLGQSFGSAGLHRDGSPTDELTDLLERVRCPGIEQGVAMAVGNKLGAVPLPDDDAGRPYRTRAEFYRKLEEGFRDSAPRMARVMRLLQRRFGEQGRWADDHRRLVDHLDAS